VGVSLCPNGLFLRVISRVSANVCATPVASWSDITQCRELSRICIAHVTHPSQGGSEHRQDPAFAIPAVTKVPRGKVLSNKKSVTPVFSAYSASRNFQSHMPSYLLSFSVIESNRFTKYSRWRPLNQLNPSRDLILCTQKDSLETRTKKYPRFTTRTSLQS